MQTRLLSLLRVGLMFYTIYKITNNFNGKCYIGKHQTKHLDDGYMGSGKLITRAIKKYGRENFTKEILHIFDNEEEMNLKEKELVVVSEDSYNLCDGGKGGFSYINVNNLGGTLGWKHTEKSLNNLKKSRAKQTFTEETRKKLSISTKKRFHNKKGTFWGKKHSSESKQKIGSANSLHQSKENNSQYGTIWITNGTQNKKIKKTDTIPDGWTKGRKI